MDKEGRPLNLWGEKSKHRDVQLGQKIFRAIQPHPGDVFFLKEEIAFDPVGSVSRSSVRMERESIVVGKDWYYGRKCERSALIHQTEAIDPTCNLAYEHDVVHVHVLCVEAILY